MDNKEVQQQIAPRKHRAYAGWLDGIWKFVSCGIIIPCFLYMIIWGEKEELAWWKGPLFFLLWYGWIYCHYSSDVYQKDQGKISRREEITKLEEEIERLKGTNT